MSPDQDPTIQPEQPIPTPVVEPLQPVVPVAPQPVAPVDAPKKSKTKLLIILGGAVVAVVAVILAIIFLVIPGVVASTLPLKEYKGEGYSLLVPESYEVKEGTSSGGATFTAPKKDGVDHQSAVSVIAFDLTGSGMTGTDYILKIDETLTEENIAKSIKESDGTLTNFDVNKSKVNGHEARKVSASFTSAKESGTYEQLIIATETGVYLVVVSAYSTDSGLVANANKIVSSFTVK